MNILYHNILRNIQIQMGKVPDSFNSRIDQSVSQLRSFCFRNGQCCHLNIIIFDKLLQIIHSADLNSAYHKPDQSRVNVKHAFDHKTALFKICIICNGLSQVSGTNDDQVMLTVNSKDLANFCVQVFYVIAIALLTESSEII